jgi:alkaline phosphatase D
MTGSNGTFSRRQVMVGLSALALAACQPRGTGSGGGYVFGVADPEPIDGMPDGLFALGVASGDPTPDGVVLWTRLAPAPLTDLGGMPDVAVPVRWQVSSDPSFTVLVADGMVTTSAAVAHSVHVDVQRLQPGQTYWYRFTTGGQVSPVGRTRTAPALDAEVDRLDLVFATCQHYEHGYYTAWSHVAADEPDLVVFLGDYIYEGGASSTRPRRHNSPEITTLDAYRKRYGLYKSDHRLQAAHAAAPWLVTWDDHEVENNYAGLVPENPADAPAFAARRAAAYQAYWEHQPIRSQPVDDGASLALHRSVTWGSLAEILVLDGRQHRSDQPCGNGATPDCAARTAPGPTMLGAEQRAWLEGRLAATDGRWSILANQTAMTPMPFGTVLNMDQWDGYPVERRAILEALSAVRNAVVLTGDFHGAGVGDLQDELVGSPVVGTELMATSITSNSSASYQESISTFVTGLPQWQWFDMTARGYGRAVITPEGMDVDFVAVDTTTDVLSPATVTTAWRIADGIPGAVPR